MGGLVDTVKENPLLLAIPAAAVAGPALFPALAGGAGAAGTTTWAVVDLSDYGDLTNWRINFNGTQAANLGTAGKCKFLYVDAANEDVAFNGIGADPS